MSLRTVVIKWCYITKYYRIVNTHTHMGRQERLATIESHEFYCAYKTRGAVQKLLRARKLLAFNPRALKFSPLNKIHFFQCVDKIFWVEFDLQFSDFTQKYLTLKDMRFTQCWDFHIRFWNAQDICIKTSTVTWIFPGAFCWPTIFSVYSNLLTSDVKWTGRSSGSWGSHQWCLPVGFMPNLRAGIPSKLWRLLHSKIQIMCVLCKSVF